LLDDIFDKLDGNRMSELMKIVDSGRFGQIFITDTSLIRIPELLREENMLFKAFKIDAGGVENV